MAPDKPEVGANAPAAAPDATTGNERFAPTGRHAGQRAVDDRPANAPVETETSVQSGAPAPQDAPGRAETLAEQVTDAALNTFGPPSLDDQRASDEGRGDEADPDGSADQAPTSSDAEGGVDAEIAGTVTNLGTALKFVRLFSDLANPTNIAIVSALIVVAITGYFGGWDAVEADASLYKHLETGETVEASPYEITVSDMFFTDDLGPLGLVGQDEVYLVMRAKVKNTSPRAIPQMILAESICVNLPTEPENRTVSQLERPSIRRVVDSANVNNSQPGLDVDYWFTWEMPSVTARPPEVRLSFLKHTWRPSSLDGGHMWTDPELVAVQIQPIAPNGKVR